MTYVFTYSRHRLCGLPSVSMVGSSWLTSETLMHFFSRSCVDGTVISFMSQQFPDRSDVPRSPYTDAHPARHVSLHSAGTSQRLAWTSALNLEQAAEGSIAPGTYGPTGQSAPKFTPKPQWQPETATLRTCLIRAVINLSKVNR